MTSYYVSTNLLFLLSTKILPNILLQDTVLKDFTASSQMAKFKMPIFTKIKIASVFQSCVILVIISFKVWSNLGCRYEDAFNRFIDEINSVAAYDWWEGSVHSILSVVAYPCAWSWKQWRRRVKISRLQEYVKSEYDHSCLRSCRSRALYKGMKVWLAKYSLRS